MDMQGPSWRLLIPQSPVPEPVKAIAFWSAIILPFIYLPLLFVGLHTVSLQALFGLLIVLNGAMILIGHQYGQ